MKNDDGNLNEEKAAWLAKMKKEKEHTLMDPGLPCTDDCQARHARTDASAMAQIHRGRTLKILCLHGGNGNASAFKHELAQLDSQLGALAEFIYAEAPRQTSATGKCWFGKAPEDADAYWVDSVRHLQDVIATQGPFDGVLGYSMGASGAFHLLAAVPEDTFKFAVVACGYSSAHGPEIARQLESRCPLRTPTLICMGRNDPTIPNEMSLGCLQHFAPGVAELSKHPGGHHVPADPIHVNHLAAFLLRFAT